MLVACTSSWPRLGPSPSRGALPQEVPVLLTGLEGKDAVTATLDGRELNFRPSAVGVDCSDGRSAARLVSGNDRSIWTLGKRRYRGRLVVEPRPGGGLRVFQRASLPDYVAGVLAGELVLWSAQPAELEAQAIASRTFAARKLLAGSQWLRDDTGDQRYIGMFRPANEAEAPLQGRIQRAVDLTRGVVLVDRTSGELASAHFHAACGGKTATPAVFGNATRASAFEGAVHCEPCSRRAATASSPQDDNLRWSVTLSAEEWQREARALGIGDRLRSLRPTATDAAGRWIEVELTGNRARTHVSFEDLRGRFGPTRLKSASIVRQWPEAGAPLDGGLLLEGLGRGHGVGLCQEGMRGYAKQGWTGADILTHYYPGAHIERRATGLL